MPFLEYFVMICSLGCILQNLTCKRGTLSYIMLAAVAMGMEHATTGRQKLACHLGDGGYRQEVIFFSNFKKFQNLVKLFQ